MHTRIKADIIGRAISAPTEEVCGFIYASPTGAMLYPCPNVAARPHEEFAIDVQDHIGALRQGELLGVYHSHPVATAFSPDDLDYATEIALPQYLYSVPDQQWHSYLPTTYQPPLEGRQWVLGFHDCYSVPRDHYRAHFGHHMQDYDRDETFCHEEQGVILANYEKEGFEPVPIAEIREHDVLLFRSEKALPQHFGVYLGGNHFLHHPRGGLCHREQLTDRWISRIVGVFRRKIDAVSV